MQWIAQKLAEFSTAFRQAGLSLHFTMLEIGGVPLDSQAEPFHLLLDSFPGSQVIAFELDPELCAELNKTARPGLQFHAVPLGRREEVRTLYETRHPMCASLYEPNQPLLSLFGNLEVAYLQKTSSVTTTSLDHFAENQGLRDIDFVKIDIQGAELDVFQGGIESLKNVVAIVSEVGFIPLYVGQPLFSDVATYLAQNGLMFHKFLGMAGRSLRPVILNDDPNFASQHMWSDAVFIRQIDALESVPDEKLLKMGVFAYLYGSPDLTHFCFAAHDQRRGTRFAERVFA